jgi:ribose 5-phosphate isomerase B
MKVTIGSDHAGYALKRILHEYIAGLGHTVLNVGTDSSVPVDYPDIAAELCRTITGGDSERGVLICGSGVGASVAANKVPGIRAGLCHDCYSARQGVEHDNIQVLVLGSRVIGEELARDLVSSFLLAEFSGEERHRRRLEKISRMEREFGNR